MNLLTTRDLMARYGINRQRVMQIAAKRGIAPAMKAGPAYLWHPHDAERFRPGKPGRPKAE